MKIDSFFRKQAGQPDVHGHKGKLDSSACCSRKAAESSLPDEMDTRNKSDTDNQILAKGPRDATAVLNSIRDPKAGSAAVNASAPLSEATNKQSTAQPAVAKASEKQAVQAFAINLCDSPSVSAAEPAQHGQHAEEVAVDSWAADDHPHQENMNIDAVPLSCAEHVNAAAGRATSAKVHQHQPAVAGLEPVTPVVDAQTMGDEVTPEDAAANTSTAKISQDTFLTQDQRKQLLEDCLKELPLLETELDSRPDLTCGGHLVSSGSKKGSQQDLKQQVSVLVEGQSLPLMQLAQHISSLLSSNLGNTAAETQGVVEGGTSHSQAAAPEDADAAVAAAGSECVSQLVVRNIIQDVASRKSYGIQDGALAPVDAFEDVTAAYHWCWELRSLTGLPKAIKQQADAARKCRKQVLDRLKACSAYIQLAQSFLKSTKTAEAKIAKAAAKLSKLQSLQELQAVSSAAAEAAQLVRQQSAAAAKERAAKEEQTAKAAAVCKAEKARQAEADKAAREAERAAREAEKAAKAAVRAAEAEEKAKLKAEDEKKREQARQSKAAEEARKKEEKAKLKVVKKVAAQAAKKGFHSAQEMQKSQNLFMSFLKKEPRPTTPPAGPSTDNSQGASGSQQQQTHQQDTSGAEPVPPAASKKVWAPPCCEPSKQQLALMQHLDDELPGQASTAVQPVPELLAKLLQHWKKLGEQHHGTWGLPPSWARRPGAAADPEHIAATAAALYGESVELLTLRCWRRKLIKHNDSVRPPYYGSWSRQSRCVCGRKPFGREVELDYEVMSDQDWEEEPEGESLSDDAEDDDDPAGEEGEEDEEGFVVGDGYLSEDEGLRDEDGDAAMTPAGAVSAEEGEKDPIEAAQERAKARGRHVIVVLNDLAPNISWESTTNLDPALLRASLQPTIFTPELAPLQPWEQLAVQVHGRPAAAGLPAAAVAAATPAGTGTADAGANKTTEAAGTAAAAAGTTGANGAGRKQSVFPEEMLGALVQHIQANSTQGIDKLTDQFVESLHGACFSGKLTKKSVRDKIRDVTTMKKGRVPCYSVKPEYLAMLGLASGCSPRASPVPTAVWGVRYKEDVAAATPVAGDTAAGSGPAAAEAMQVDDDAAAQHNGAAATAQDLQLVAEQTVSPADAPASGPPAAAVGTSSACVAGVKRPASAEHDVQLSDPGTAGPATEGAPRASTSQLEQAVHPTQEAAAAALPPNKKQKTPGEGIARFFMNPKQQQPQQQLDGQQPQNQQAPPFTPQRQQRDAAQVNEATDAAAEAAPVANAAAAAHGNHSGVLPMLTPPSVDAGDRPSLPNSPVPFRMNAAGETDEVEAGTNGAEQQLQPQRPPINRWHAQADCRGMGLQGGSTSSIPPQLKQQQESSQPFNGFDQQQQHSLGFARASDVAAAGSGSPGVAGQALKPRLQVPQLPERGRPPDSRFWKQLATWVACVKDPDSSDIDTALSVFSEQHLKQYIQCMPQSVLSAMVKTLGSYSQSLPMRASCARCISNVAQCLAVEQQPLDATSSSPQQAGQASPGGATPAASSSTSLKRKFGASPSPGSSPRSAPVVVSFEELSAEPLLLTNLLLAAADPTNQLKRIQEVVGDGHTGDLQEAFELSRSALRATAAFVGVGLPHPLSGNKDYCPAAAAAAGELRLRIASTPQWRGTFNSAVDGKLSSPDKLRSTYALMILHSLLFDPPAASQLVNKPRLARLLVLRVLQRGATAQDWVIKKWSLLVSSMLLSDDLFQSWILPQDGLCQFHKQQKEDEEIVQGLGVLLASCINRPSARLSETGPDRIILGKCLTLTSLLVSVLGDQLRLPGNNGRLPSSVAELVGGSFGGASHDEGVLVAALKEVAMQEEWQEAAERARQLLDSLQSSMAGEEVEMQGIVSG